MTIPGEVYLARDERLERDVAIKVLSLARLNDEAARSLFRREALALSKLNHPNVQTVHDFDSQEGTDFLVTEYVPGTTLSEMVTGKGIPQKELLAIAEQLLEGLVAAHAQGIVHRDLKPANMRLMPDGRLKILDFGLAKLIGPVRHSATTLSRFETQTFAGTPHYMSPEQRAGRPADARSDIYSAGLVLRELAIGESEPDETTSTRLSAGLKRIIEKCLRDDPAERYPSADELLKDIRRLRRAPIFSRRGAIAVLVGIVALAALWANLPARAPDGINSIVALPSTLLGSDSAFLADAIPQTISTYLAQVEGLETKLPPASIDIERFAGDLDRVASTYGVDALVLSTLTAPAEQLVLNVQLVRARGRQILWSGEYEGRQSEYLALVREAAEQLRQHLRPQREAIGASSQVASSSGAELAYQRGHYYARRFNNLHHIEDFDAAYAAFQEALALDPTLADAAARIAALYEFRLEIGLKPNEAFAQINAWAQKALEIDPENGTAWVNLTLLEIGQGRTGASVTLGGLRAVRYAPRATGAHLVLGFGLSSCRLSHEAWREATRLDPLYLYPPLLSATSLACLGQKNAALAENERTLLIEPDFSIALVNKVAFLHTLGRLDEAAAILERLEPMVTEGRVHPLPFETRRDENVALSKAPGEAPAVFARLLQLASGERRFPYWQMFAQAAMDQFASLGRIDEARELLLRLDEAGIVPDYDGLMLSPDLQWIRDDPELAPIITKSRERFQETLAILEDARGRGELPAYLEEPLAELLADLGMP